MKRYIFSLMAFIFGLNLMAQKKLKHLASSNSIKIQNTEKVIVSEHPVTNRDYLVYLMWLLNTYGNDYPETFISAIPLLNRTEDYYFQSEFYESNDKIKFICDHSSYLNKEYLFNASYLDYPVVGLNWLQASKFLKWASDRYNEFILIDKGYYNLEGYQLTEDCFVTESYLMGQYEGPGKLTNTFVKWSDNLLIANFRLPTSLELDIAQKETSINNKLTVKKATNDFLTPWVKKFFNFDESTTQTVLRLNSDGFTYVLILNEFSTPIDLTKINYSELTLDLDVGLNYIDAFANQGYYVKDKTAFQDEGGFYWEKDSTGHMPFIIIDADQDNQTILLEKFKRNKSYLNDSNLSIFRYALNPR